MNQDAKSELREWINSIQCEYEISNVDMVIFLADIMSEFAGYAQDELNKNQD